MNQDNFIDITKLKGQISLNWIGKDLPIKFANGKWQFSDNVNIHTKKALVYESTFGAGSKFGGCVLKGDFLSCLECLYPYLDEGVQMLYFDTPRLSSLTAEATEGFVDSTWLSIVQNAALLSKRILKDKGFFVLHTNEDMSHYGRMVLDEVFGRDKHITTLAWEKKYAPQNDKTKNDPTDVFDYLIIYSKSDKTQIQKIGLLVDDENVIDNGDWRGVFTQGHKGAKSGSERTKFKVNCPPYHWELLDSNLQERDGVYWFDNILGVLWCKSLAVGNYWLKVKAVDKKGNSAIETINFHIREQIDDQDKYQLPKKIWWLLKDDNEIDPSGQLKIETEGYNEGIDGQEFSLVLKAKGGKPFKMRKDSPGQNRYWEFGKSSLIRGIATAIASFGNTGNALPSIKKYYDRDDTRKLEAITNFLPWWDYGKSEDATRHTKSYTDAGLTPSNSYSDTAKPQKLYALLIESLVQNNNDAVVALGDYNAAFSSVALKMNRVFYHVTGGSFADLNQWETVAKVRLESVSQNQDQQYENQDPMPETFNYEALDKYIDVFTIDSNAIEIDTKGKSINKQIFTNVATINDYYAGLVGAFKRDGETEYKKRNGDLVLVYPEESILDTLAISQISSKYDECKVIIIAERIADDISTPQNITVYRAPFELLGL